MAKEAIVLINPQVKGTNRVWLAEVDVTIVTSNVNSDRRDVLYHKRFSGSAVRNPQDRQSDRVGCEMALGRALESAGRKLQKIAWRNIPDVSNVSVVEVQTIKPKAKKSAAKKKDK